MSTRSNLGSALEGGKGGCAIVDLWDRERPRELDFARLDDLANGAARGLRARGIARGQTVAIVGENSVEFVAAFLGILRLGAIAVPINFKFPDPTLRYVLEDAAPEVVFVDRRNATRLPESRQAISLVPEAFAEFVDPGEFTTVKPRERETGLVLYTSGSTGRPKGVVLSHSSQWTMVERMYGGAQGVRGMVAAPLYHMNAILNCFGLLYGRGTVVLLPRFDARFYLEALAAYQVNVVTGVPTMLSLMARERDLVERLDLCAVKAVVIGSAPLSTTVIDETRTMFPGARISNGYGTTEAGAGMFGAHPNGIDTPPLALGYPASHVEVRLVGGTSERQGVLQVKTPAAMNGYLNDPEKTAAKMSDDGWIDTGDVMRIDDDGFYYFVGRDDDMFVCGGENVFPGEVERVLELDPRIVEACVVPVADPVRGQMPVAFVTVSRPGTIDEQGVKDLALAGVPAYMHPRRVYFLDAMPLAGTNKIDRKALEQNAAQTVARDRANPPAQASANAPPDSSAR